MSYTPGPWSLERDCNGVPEFVFGGDTCVCDFGIEAPKPEDARLIAAAPELFEACTLAMDVMNNEDATGLDLYECRLILTRACTKAIGVPALEFVEQELAFVARERAKMGGKSA